jgi:hypothetical protein
LKSIHHGKTGANAKLKGKLTHSLSCGCCTMQNFKWKEKLKEMNKDILNFKKYKN